MSDMLRIGIDIGSTTVKVVVINEKDEMLFSRYERHYSEILETVKKLVSEAHDEIGDASVSAMITGSGGVALSEAVGIPFIQEVVATANAIESVIPQTDVAIELGGEDAKIIYFEGGNAEERMNGICAGGTGSFIDQMASLLQTDAGGLNELAKSHKIIYPIASRCGVFAKTDIQPLINEGAARDEPRGFNIPGRCQSDDQRTCLRKTYQRTCGVSRRTLSTFFRNSGRDL